MRILLSGGKMSMIGKAEARRKEEYEAIFPVNT
jgi:hypothetical protein